MDGFVPALLRSDRPRAARLVRLGTLAVVGALAVGAADGVDGGEVEDVEAHLGDVRQPFLDVAKRSVLAAFAGRPGEHLVPGAVASPLRLYQDFDLAPVSRRKAAVW